jgi:hypothetical protein
MRLGQSSLTKSRKQLVKLTNQSMCMFQSYIRQRNTLYDFRLYEIEWNFGAIDVGLSVQIESVSFQEIFGTSFVKESIELPLFGDSIHFFSSNASNVIMQRHVEFGMQVFLSLLNVLNPVMFKISM